MDVLAVAEALVEGPAPRGRRRLAVRQWMVVASRLRCRSRIVGLAAFRVKRVHLLRRVFIDAVGLGFEYGGFPGLLLRLFLHRVTG